MENSTKSLDRAYLKWLCERITRRQSDPTCRQLALDLHRRDFRAIVPHDENRYVDGLKLRECFGMETNNPEAEEMLDGPCSVLEMLVALAERMDFILASADNDWAKWFWILVKNLGLKPYLLSEPDAKKKRAFNDLVIKKLVERSYADDGKGGLFPLRRPKEDQREVEIWYQMMAWIRENYPQ